MLIKFANNFLNNRVSISVAIFSGYFIQSFGKNFCIASGVKEPSYIFCKIASCSSLLVAAYSSRNISRHFSTIQRPPFSTNILYKRNYERFRKIYNAEDTTYLPLETSKYYKNIYRRYRDYGTLVIALGYVLQIIDANVFAYMHNFEVTEDLAIDVSPTVICPGDNYAFTPGGPSPAFGMSVGFKF